MNIRFNVADSKCNPDAAPSGSKFRARTRGADVLVLKVHNSLYVALYNQENAEFTDISYNGRWFDEWKDPVLLPKGSTITITV